MYHNLERWFAEHNLQNHKFCILETAIESSEHLAALQSYDEIYKATIYNLLDYHNTGISVYDAYVDRAGQDSVISKAAFVYYFAKLDSDNWIHPKQLFEVLDQCQVRRSDEYAVVLRCGREIYTSWNYDSMKLSVVLIELAD